MPSRPLLCCPRCLRPSSGKGGRLTGSSSAPRDATTVPPCADWPECKPVSQTAEGPDKFRGNPPLCRLHEWDTGIKAAIRILCDEGISYLNGCDGHGVSAAWIGMDDIEEAKRAVKLLRRYAPKIVGLKLNADGSQDLAVVLHKGVKTEGLDGK